MCDEFEFKCRLDVNSIWLLNFCVIFLSVISILIIINCWGFFLKWGLFIFLIFVFNLDLWYDYISNCMFIIKMIKFV